MANTNPYCLKKRSVQTRTLDIVGLDGEDPQGKPVEFHVSLRPLDVIRTHRKVQVLEILAYKYLPGQGHEPEPLPAITLDDGTVEAIEVNERLLDSVATVIAMQWEDPARPDVGLVDELHMIGIAATMENTWIEVMNATKELNRDPSKNSSETGSG